MSYEDKQAMKLCHGKKGYDVHKKSEKNSHKKRSVKSVIKSQQTFEHGRRNRGCGGTKAPRTFGTSGVQEGTMKMI